MAECPEDVLQGAVHAALRAISSGLPPDGIIPSFKDLLHERGHSEVEIKRATFRALGAVRAELTRRKVN